MNSRCSHGLTRNHEPHVSFTCSIPDDLPFNTRKYTLTVPQQVFSAAFGSILTTCVVNPIDVIKTRLQIRPNSISSWTHITTILRREGVRSLFNGIFVSVLMQAPATAIYLTIYERLRQNLEQKYNFNTTVSVMIAGAAGRTVSATLTSPFEYTRTLLQAGKVHSAVGNMKNTIAVRGWTSIFVGLTPTLLRDVPFTMIYWSLYVNGKTCLENNSKLNFSLFSNPLSSNDKGSYQIDLTDITNNFIAASISAVIASAITTPFDTIKTKRQVASHDSKKGSDLKLATIIKKIVKTEGYKGLFRGLFPRMVKVVPSCAITISTYELLKDFFEDVNDSRNLTVPKKQN